MNIAAVQMSMTENMEDNFRKSIKYLHTAKEQGADIVLYPEIQLSPFFPQYESFDADKFLINSEHKYFKDFCAACRENSIMASPNFYFEDNGKKYDMSFLIGIDGNVIGSQKMVHIAQAEKFYEQSYYTPSEEGFNVFDTPHGQIAIIICFDRHYPESIRAAALKDADLVLIPTANITDEPLEMFEWEVRVQSFQNSVPIVMCNRTGKEGAVTFSGQSIWTDAEGNLIKRLGSGEEIGIANIDLSQTKSIRQSKPYTSLIRNEY